MKIVFLTPEIEKRCLYLYELGNNDRHIALKLNKKFGVNLVAKDVQIWRNNKNLPSTGTYGNISCTINDLVGDKIISMIKEGKTLIEISFELGISFGRLKTWIYKHNIPAKKLMGLNRKEIIIKLFKEGYSDKEISKKVGGTPRAIYQWRRRQGYL